MGRRRRVEGRRRDLGRLLASGSGSRSWRSTRRLLNPASFASKNWLRRQLITDGVVGWHLFEAASIAGIGLHESGHIVRRVAFLDKATAELVNSLAGITQLAGSESTAIADEPHSEAFSEVFAAMWSAGRLAGLDFAQVIATVVAEVLSR